MNLALIARYDNSGLGTLSRSFAEHLKPKKVLLVSNGIFHTFPERYSAYDTKIARPALPFMDSEKQWLIDGIDVLLSIETFYDWSIVLECRRKKVKTALVTMCEMTPEQVPYHADLYLCPSKLDFRLFKRFGVQRQYIPIPINTKKIQWRKRDKAEIFIHTASHGGQNNRKGTHLLIEAMKYTQSTIKLIIYSWIPFECDDPRVEVKLQNFKDYWQIWNYGDVLAYPQDYNGICLPIIEAMSAGMGVITTNIFPFNEYMPKELLFEPEEMYNTRVQFGTLEMEAARINPRTIAAKIDEWAHKDISRFSEYGKKWAERNSWNVLLPFYQKALQLLCKQK